METIFPDHKGYQGLFIVGFRKDPDNGATQRTGTAILKRTYDVDSTGGTLTPAAEALPIFLQDQPDNLMLNSDFESCDDNKYPIEWHPTEGVTIARADEDPGDPETNHFLEMRGNANGRVVQTLTFAEPLGGRQFVLSFFAKADDAARIEGAQLEADGADEPICVIGADLGDETMGWSEGTGTWPADLEATEMRVVLRMATDAARTVFYDNVQVEERDHATVWDPATTLRYEHDLASFKPEGDMIVLGFTDVEGTSKVRVGGVDWLSRVIASSALAEKALFGWEPRVDESRKGEAGTYPEEKDAYPLPADDPLPGDFVNRFYNGYRRTNPEKNITTTLPDPSYLPAAAQIEIGHDGTVDYQLTLRGDAVTATYYYYDGTGPDQESNWRGVPVTVNLDTLVIEPEKNHCYVVWRGVWPFDERDAGAYRRLVVEASA